MYVCMCIWPSAEDLGDLLLLPYQVPPPGLVEELWLHQLQTDAEQKLCSFSFTLRVSTASLHPVHHHLQSLC